MLAISKSKNGKPILVPSAGAFDASQVIVLSDDLGTEIKQALDAHEQEQADAADVRKGLMEARDILGAVTDDELRIEYFKRLGQTPPELTDAV